MKGLGYIYVLGTVLLTVYGQLILKWRLNQINLPTAVWEKAIFLVKLVFDPYVFSSFLSAFLASLTWMAALKEFDLSRAYPIMSLSFVLVLIAGHFFLNEPISVGKLIGTLLILSGIFVIAHSN